MESSPAQATPVAQQPTITFVIRPQPVTVWLQFDDSSPMGDSPTPHGIASNIMGMPMMGGLPIFMMPSVFGGAGGAGSFERNLHELFLRTQNEQHGPPPTSKAFLEKIPLKTWTMKMAQDEKHTDCPICLCDYEENDQVLPLPCGHQFHNECGMKWLLEHNVCPTCRYALPTKESSAVKPEATVTSSQSPAMTVTATPARSEPEAEEDVTRTSRVRQRSPRHESERFVRRRISEMESQVLPGSSATADDALDSLLEEEANRFVAEEQQKQRFADVGFDDSDVEDLLHDTSC